MRRAVLLFSVVLLAYVGLPSLALAEDVIVQNDLGNPDMQERINKKIDDATHDDVSHDPESGTVTLQASDQCYKISGSINLVNDLVLEGAGQANTKICRSTSPGGMQSNTFMFLKGVTSQPETGLKHLTIRDLTIDGLRTTDVHPNNRKAFVDKAITIRARETRFNATEYAQDITVEDVDIIRMQGYCLSLSSAKVFNVDEVRCLDPSKDGLLFNYGARDGAISNVTVTSSGDDAIAFNSATGGGESDEPIDPEFFSTVSDITLRSSTIAQDNRVQEGAPLAIRGAQDLTISNNNIGPDAPERAAVFVFTGTNTMPGGGYEGGVRFDPINIDIDNTYGRNVIDNTNDGTGVDVATRYARGVRIAGNLIKYLPGECGIRIAAGATVTFPRPNTFQPPGPNTVCRG